MIRNMQYTKDLVLKRRLRTYIAKSIKERKDAKLPQDFQFLYNKDQNICSRIMWITFLCFSIAICCYQVYDRFTYFISGPISVDISMEQEDYVKPIPFRFYAFDTAALRPYWDETNYFGPRKLKAMFGCSLPVRTLVREGINYRNFEELWKATNITPHIDYIAFNEAGKKNNVYFENGKASKDLNKIISYSNTICGMATNIILPEKVKVGTVIHFAFVKDCFCDRPLVTMATNDLLPYRIVLPTQSGSKSTFTYSKKSYRFLNSKKTPCQKDDNKTKRCYEKCMQEKFEKFTCRLPFMPSEIHIKNCDELRNTSIPYAVYNKAYLEIITTLATADCKCPRACQSDVLQIRALIQLTNNEDRVDFMFEITDEANVMTSERLAYNFGPFLADVGGNLGLFLGLSVLSIIQIGQVIVFHNRKKKISWLKGMSKREQKLIESVVEKMLDSREKNSGMVLKNTLFGNRRSLVGQVFYAMITCFTAVSAIYLSYQRGLLYMSNPTRNVVVVEENTTIYLPNLIICGESDIITNKKVMLSRKTGVPICDVHYLDLLNISKGWTLDHIWRKQKLTAESSIVDQISTALGLNISPLRTTKNESKMHTGTCDEYSFPPRPFAGMATTTMFSYRSALNPICTDDMYQVYIRPPDTTIYAILKSYRNIWTESTGALTIAVTKTKALNTSRKVCVGKKEFEDCQYDCFTQKIENNVSCSLPFMTNITHDECTNSVEAKESYLAFIKIAYQTDAERDCFCKPACEKTIYKTILYFQEPDTWPISVLAFSTFSNMVEIVNQESSYDLVALLSDVGSSFGLTMGLSLLALSRVFQFTITSVNVYLTRKMK